MRVRIYDGEVEALKRYRTARMRRWRELWEKREYNESGMYIDSRG